MIGAAKNCLMAFGGSGSRTPLGPMPRNPQTHPRRRRRLGQDDPSPPCAVGARAAPCAMDQQGPPPTQTPGDRTRRLWTLWYHKSFARRPDYRSAETAIYLALENGPAASEAQPEERDHERPMILTLAAVLGIAAGSAAISPAAQAAQSRLLPPAQNGNG